MKFHLAITVDGKFDKSIKDQCMQAVAEYLSFKGYSFDVGYDPNEIDTDLIGKA